MLTPVDLQQKRFHIGIGYDKKDVNTFFDEVCESYQLLFRANAELTDEVATLRDTLQNYRTKEADLEKTILLAMKDSEDTKSEASKAAKTLILDAKNKAHNIVKDAKHELEDIEQKMTILETRYANYKSNFASLLKRQAEDIESNDFDVESYIDERAVSLIGGGNTPQASNDDGFGSFSGDPQMRDSSSLGGGLGSGGFGSGADVTSTSAVYTAGLGKGSAFVDPFSQSNKQPGRYNPYDDMGKTTGPSKPNEKTKLKVNTRNTRSNFRPVDNEDESSKKVTSFSSEDVRKEEKKEASTSTAPKSENKPHTEVKAATPEARRNTSVPEDRAEEPKNTSIPTIDNLLKPSDAETSKDDETLVGDIASKDANLLGDGNDTVDENDVFEFVD